MTGGVVRVGDTVRFQGALHTVAGLGVDHVTLLDASLSPVAVLRGFLFADPSFEVLSSQPTGGARAVEPLAQLDWVDPDEAQRVRELERHLLEVYAPELAGAALPDYAASLPVGTRERNKLRELAALGMTVGLSTLRRWHARHEAEGLIGLLDRRQLRRASPTGQVDERVVDVLREVLREQRDLSTGTRGRVVLQAQRLLEERYGPEGVVLPSRATLYRVIATLAKGTYAFDHARTRRSNANRPKGSYTRTHASRPGEVVQFDTTRLDVLGLYDTDTVGAVELTIALDVHTRSILAWRLTPADTKAVDAALLLAQILTPEFMRPGWRETLQMAHAVVPYQRLVSLDQRLELAAARPVMLPENVVVDRAKIYASETFTRACRRLGISVQPTRPYTATDKAIIERTFESINTLFCQHVAGYKGADVSRRGADVEGQAVWTLAELEDLFAEWVVVGWQNRPHEALWLPGRPQTKLSPNEVYGSAIAVTGYIACPLSGQDYVQLLPCQWRKVTREGVRINNLTYDAAALGPYREQHSGIARHNGKWPIHSDPGNLLVVYLYDHHQQLAVPLPWVHADMVGEPFADVLCRHAWARLRNRGEQADEVLLAEELRDLLDRLGGPVADRREQRVVGRNAIRVANAEQTAARFAAALPTPASLGAGADTDGDEPVLPLGVFDPYAERDEDLL
jgi:transposase InsO family protein